MVRSILKNHYTYCQLLSTPRPPILTARETRSLLNSAAEGDNSWDELHNDFQLQGSKSTIRRAHNNSGVLLYFKMKSTPYKTPKHKTFRLEWAEENIKYKQEEWWCIMFSDEKKINLDGPDGWAY